MLAYATNLMPVMIAMLRGVNVGGNHKLPMARLRQICEELGLERPETFIQSGNILFETEDIEAAERMEAAIEREFSFRAAVIMRSAAELREVVKHNPFQGRDGARSVVTFLKADPGEQVREAVRAIQAEPEELRIAGREMYVYYPNGMGRTKLPIPRIERMFGCPSTTRNWNTVEKLLAMAEAR